MEPPPKPSAKRRLLLAAGILLALGLLVRAALPALLAAWIEREASAALGRSVEVGDVDLALLAGGASLEGLVVGAALDAEPLASEAELDAEPLVPAAEPLRLERLAFDLSWASLLGGELVVTELAFDAPRLQLLRDSAGEIEPLVLAHAEPAEEEADPGEGGWPFRLDRIHVRDVEVYVIRQGPEALRDLEFTLTELSLVDLALRDGVVTVGDLAFDGPELRVRRELADAPAPASPPPVASPPPEPEPESAFAGHRLESLDLKDAQFTLLWDGGQPLRASLDLTARGVSAGRGERFPLELTLRSEGAVLEARGELGFRPFAFEGDVEWTGLALKRLLEASGADLELALDSGTSDGALKLVAATESTAGAPAQLRFSGEASFSSVGGKLPGAEIAWSELAIQLQALEIPLAAGAPATLRLGRVDLREPRLFYTRERAPAEPGSDEAAPDGGEALLFWIDELEVTDGELRFVDDTPPEPFSTRWQRIGLQAEGIRWPERDVERVTLRAFGPEGARLAMDASLAAGTGLVKTRIQRLGVAHLDPYAAEFTGLRFESGRASLESKVKIGRTRTRTDSVLRLHELSLSEREEGWFEGAFGIPLDVALALLRDLNGDIAVPIRAEFEGEETRVGLASLVASTLRQAVVGAVTSPLKLLGSLAELAGEALESGLAPLDALAGAAELESDAEERLGQLAHALIEKPALQLVLRGSAGPEDDAGIARRRLIQQARAGDALEGDSTLGFLERRRLRKALARLDPEAADTLEAELESLLVRLVAAAEVTDANRNALASLRALAVREALLEQGAPAEALAVEAPQAGDPGVALEMRARPAAAAVGEDADAPS